jgi:CobQ-like glutamine amidotransferase family enzyme
MVEQRVLRLAHLYPDVMNIYGDRGNVIALRYRCEARGIELGSPTSTSATPSTRPTST